MDQQQIEIKIEELLELEINGGDVENPKIDFKKQWYDLTSIDGKMEFLKDTSAIANTLGNDGFIVIGFDSKTKQLHDAQFRQSGLTDTSQINGIIAKNCDSLFAVNHYQIICRGSNISVLHIPVSLTMPNIIKNYVKGDRTYEQITFMRQGSTTRIANKNATDLMYAYRGVITPEYEVLSSMNLNGIMIHANDIYTQHWRQLDLPDLPSAIRFISKITVDFENMGRRPISIVNVIIKFSSKDEEDERLETFSYNFHRVPILVQVGQINTVILEKSEEFGYAETTKQKAMRQNKLTRNIIQSYT